MLFNSYIFLLCFLPVSILGYYLLGRARTPTGAKVWLAIASFVFYGWWNPGFVVLLLVSIAVNFSLSMLIVDAEDKPNRQRALLTIGVVLNLSALVYYKYLFVVLEFFHLHGFIARISLSSFCRWAFLSSPSRRSAIWSTASGHGEGQEPARLHIVRDLLSASDRGSDPASQRDHAAIR